MATKPSAIDSILLRFLKLAVSKFVLTVFFIAVTATDSFSQGFPDYEDGLKVELGEGGQKYFRLMTWHQVWTRFNNNNSGSTRLEQEEGNTVDFGVRRARFLMYAQLDKRFFILTHMGINNQTGISGGFSGIDGRRPQLFMHDVYVEYTVFGEKLHVGGGLHYWNGLSRMSSAGTLNFLAMDAPIFNWPTIDATDQFARRIGIFAKGVLGQWNYQFSVTDPFKTNLEQDILPNKALYSPFNGKKVVEGYVSYSLFEQESNLLPFRTGTYLGTKKVLSIGGGFMHNGNAMWYEREAGEGIPGDTIFTDMTLLSVDAFLDLPLNQGNNGAITLYSVISKYMTKNVRYSI